MKNKKDEMLVQVRVPVAVHAELKRIGEERAEAAGLFQAIPLAHVACRFLMEATGYGDDT